jgi:uncharacterized protein (TIRG00374 family)
MIDQTTSEPKQPRQFLRMLPGIVISAAAVLILLLQIDLQETAAAFGQVRWWRMGAAFAVLMLAFVLRSAGWRVLLREQASLGDAFSATGIGYLLNTILPFRLGEVGRALALGLRSPLSFWEIFPTVVIERIFDLGFLAAVLFGTLPFVVGAQWATSAAILSALLVVAGFGLLYGIVLNPGWVQGVLGWFSGRWPKLRTFGEEKIDLLLRGLAVLRNPRRFLLVFLWIGGTWVLTVIWNLIVLVTFFPSPTLLQTGFIVGVAAVGVAAPSTQGNLGVYEAAVVSAFAALAADPAQGLAYALVTHGLYLLVVFVLGFAGLTRTGISLNEIYSQAKTQQT